MEPKALLETRLDSLDGWAVLFTLLVVLGVGGELVVHIMSSRTSKRLIEIQKAEEQQRQAEIARLTKEAEIARKDIAEAHARAAEANQKAEEEKLARVKIEEKLAPRHLSAEQQRRIVSALKPFAGQTLNVFAYSGAAEVVGIANEVIAALGPSGAGWNLFVSAGQEGSGRAVPGMLVEFKPGADAASMAAARALVAALTHERLAVGGPTPIWMGGGGMMGQINEDPNAQIKLTIANKP